MPVCGERQQEMEGRRKETGRTEGKYRGEIPEQEIRKWSDRLLFTALARCGDLEDARDLVQDTLLTFFTYRAGGKTVENPSAFLHTVLDRKYYDMLRRKYQIPVMTIDFQDAGETLACEEDYTDSVIRKEENERIRREVTFLAESYRTIIAGYYFHNKSIQEISRELQLPQGTVKSRLDFGRKQIKKGFEIMENYTENSYIPHHLMVRNSGSCGLAEEPMSLTDDDLLAQNLLILAYDKPVSVSELSRAIGVSSAYVEPVVNKLVKGELMKRMGDGRIYTDFIIYQGDDFRKYREEQEAFAAEYAEIYCNAVKTAIEELKATPFYSLRLERYMLINIAESGTWRSLSGIQGSYTVPARPNGGRWIAFGTIDPPGFPQGGNQDDSGFWEKYQLSGQRCTVLDGYLGSEKLKLYNYESFLYPCRKFDGCEFGSFMETETNLLKLFYLIRKGISPETVGCDPRILKAVPLLEKQGYLTVKGDAPRLLVPCLTFSEERLFWSVCEKASAAFAAGIQKPMEEYASGHKVKIPPHLKSVPEQKRTMPYEPKAMMFVFEAINRGIHPRDLGYVCPETLAVME